MPLKSVFLTTLSVYLLFSLAGAEITGIVDNKSFYTIYHDDSDCYYCLEGQSNAANLLFVMKNCMIDDEEASMPDEYMDLFNQVETEDPEMQSALNNAEYQAFLETVKETESLDNGLIEKVSFGVLDTKTMKLNSMMPKGEFEKSLQKGFDLEGCSGISTLDTALSSTGILNVLTKDDKNVMRIFQFNPSENYKYIQSIVLKWGNVASAVNYQLHVFNEGVAIRTLDIMTGEFVDYKLHLFEWNGKAVSSFDLETEISWSFNTLHFISKGCLWEWNGEVLREKKNVESLSQKVHRLKKEEWEPGQQELVLFDEITCVIQCWKDKKQGNLRFVIDDNGDVSFQEVVFSGMSVWVIPELENNMIYLRLNEYTETNGWRNYQKAYFKYDLTARSLHRLDNKTALPSQFSYSGSFPVYFSETK